MYFGGGNRYHLMEWIARSGFSRELPRLMREKVYVGMSGGSMVTASTLNLDVSHVLFEDDLDRSVDREGLGLVDFLVVPHLNNPYFHNLREDVVARFAATSKSRIYALDDNSAVKVDDDGVTVVSEGTWRVYP